MSMACSENEAIRSEFHLFKLVPQFEIKSCPACDILSSLQFLMNTLTLPCANCLRIPLDEQN